MTFTVPPAVSTTHFDLVLSHWGQSLTLYRYTGYTSNISGDLSNTYDSGESVTGVFLKRKQVINYEKEGFVEVSDGYVMFKYSDFSSDPPEKHDKIEFNGETFEIENVINRFDIFYFCNLIKVE